MRYSFLWIVFVVLFCVTCSRAALDRDSFTALLIDMHTTDGILAEVGERRDGGRTDYMYYNALFEKYGITRADFDSCLNYYTRRPEIFQAIYDAVVDTPQHLRSRLVCQVIKCKSSAHATLLFFFPQYTKRK